MVGNHDVEGFGLLASITKEQNGRTEQTLLEDPQHLTETEKFVTDAITALRNYKPLWRMLLLPVGASLAAAAFLWFLLKKILKF